MSFFPQQFAHEYFAALAVVALACTLALVVHMNRAWPTFVTKSQRLRYLSLLYACTLTVVAMSEQFKDDSPVKVRNIGTAGFLLLSAYAIYVTFCEERERRKGETDRLKRRRSRKTPE